jgi:hypothetical protein
MIESVQHVLYIFFLRPLEMKQTAPFFLTFSVMYEKKEERVHFLEKKRSSGLSGSLPAPYAVQYFKYRITFNLISVNNIKYCSHLPLM